MTKTRADAWDSTDTWGGVALLVVLLVAPLLFGSLGLVLAVPASLAVLATYRLAKTRGEQATWEVVAARAAFATALVICVGLCIVIVRAASRGLGLF